jgi:hypothetical protein
VAAVAVPRDQWAGLLRGAGMPQEIANAFVAMYDGINGGLVTAEAGSERHRGAVTLSQAAQALAG